MTQKIDMSELTIDRCEVDFVINGVAKTYPFDFDLVAENMRLCLPTFFQSFPIPDWFPKEEGTPATVEGVLIVMMAWNTKHPLPSNIVSDPWTLYVDGAKAFGLRVVFNPDTKREEPVDPYGIVRALICKWFEEAYRRTQLKKNTVTLPESPATTPAPSDSTNSTLTPALA